MNNDTRRPIRCTGTDSKTYDVAVAYGYGWADERERLFSVVVARSAKGQPLGSARAIRAARLIAQNWDDHPFPLWRVTADGSVISDDGAHELKPEVS